MSKERDHLETLPARLVSASMRGVTLRIASSVVLVLALALPAAARPGPLDVARDDFRTAQSLAAKSARNDAERLDNLRRAVQLLKDARNVVNKVGSSAESDYLGRLIDEALAEATPKLKVVEFRVGTRTESGVEIGPPSSDVTSSSSSGARSGARERTAPKDALDGTDYAIVGGVAVVVALWLSSSRSRSR